MSRGTESSSRRARVRCFAVADITVSDIGPHKTHLFLDGPVKLHCAAAAQVHIVPVGALGGGIGLHYYGVYALSADILHEVINLVCRLGI